MPTQPSIHQLVAGYQRGDAISNTAVLMQRIFRDWGHPSAIYCERGRTSPELRPEVRDLDTLAQSCRPGDIALLHLSIGCRANLLFPSLPCRKVILYHNITPDHYFRHLNPAMAESLAEGRRQAAALAGAAELNLADSAFNARELAAMGYESAGVLPLLVDLRGMHREISTAFRARFDDGAVNVLFVGRVVPNKRHDDLLRVFDAFQHTVEPRSRLLIVGSFHGAEVYHSLLLGAVHALELKRVVFTGAVSQAELNACYRCASVFLCMSEHEGFCAPLLEAMHHDLPVLAADAAAVPETLDGAGILFHERNPALIAETMGRAVQDPAFREAVLARQRQRLRAYLDRDFAGELHAALGRLLNHSERRAP